ncbi:TetR/AcrR family transcriptional regulator [Nonomuraea angiospora]|uniref:TetR/AcrR family transcriptional regulator n=1 Tax=Nonomuraea angiospora TaxID=46172 RepID=UPI0029B0C512|nr:TetR family transcriptional regulator [Nonomuraea angiospora]MDX3100968.1 TetR family transcriptional regulator [Nonomuraea angiospora]
MESLSLRERTRLAVRQQLLDTALALFLEQGYEATTVEEIAAAAGMSKRSFFRYFGSKEDVILGKHERLGEQFIDALRARPLDEPLWTSLRRMFDDVVDYMADPAQAAGAAELQRVINGSPSLRAAYLDRMLGNQSRIADAARERAHDAGHGWDDADPAPLALVGAAFACLTAANASAAAGGVPLREALDRAMAAVGPRA